MWCLPKHCGAIQIDIFCGNTPGLGCYMELLWDKDFASLISGKNVLTYVNVTPSISYFPGPSFTSSADFNCKESSPVSIYSLTVTFLRVFFCMFAYIRVCRCAFLTRFDTIVIIL